MAGFQTAADGDPAGAASPHPSGPGRYDGKEAQARAQAQAQRRPGPGWVAVRQAVALTRKNVLTRLRSPGLLLGQLLSGVALVGAVAAVDAALRFSDSGFGGAGRQESPEARAVGAVPLCSESPFLRQGAACHTLLYSPRGDLWVEEVVAGVAGRNVPPIPPEQMRGFDSVEEVDAYLWDHPETVLAAAHFRRRPTQPTAPPGAPEAARPRALSYVLQTNASAAWFKGRFQDPNTAVALPLQVAIEAAVARLASGDPSLPWSVSLADFPHPSLATASAVGRFAPTFLLAATVVNCIVLLTSMVTERESGVRGALTAMGLRDVAHWVSWVLPEALLTAAHAALLLGAAAAMRLTLATGNDPALLFLLLWGGELAMSSVALLLSALLRKASAAVPVGFAVYVIAWALQLDAAPQRTANDGGAGSRLAALFSCLPPPLLTKGLVDLASATLDGAGGISWSARSSYCWSEPPPPAVRASLPYWQSDCVMPVGRILWILPLQALIFTLIAAYLDALLPREPGGPWALPWEPLAGALLPAAWRGGGAGGRRAASARRVAKALARAERDAAAAAAAAPPLPLSLLAAAAPSGPVPAAAAMAAAPAGPLESSGVPTEAAAAPTVVTAAAALALAEADPGVVAEAAAVQGLCRRYVAATSAEADAAGAGRRRWWRRLFARSPSAASYGMVTSARDDSFGVAAGGAGGGLERITEGHEAPDGAGGGAAGNVIDDGGESDWTQGVVLFGLRKVYGRLAVGNGGGGGARGWFRRWIAPGPVGRWWRRRQRRYATPPALLTAAAAAGSPEALLAADIGGGAAAPNTAAAAPAAAADLGLDPKASAVGGGKPNGGGRDSGGGKAGGGGGGGGGAHVAVEGTWLRILPGECFCLLGPNGAGKTTTLRCLIGSLRPSSGEALVRGHSLASPAGLEAARAATGLCPQFDCCWPELSGREHLQLAGAVRGLGGAEAAAEAERMLKMVKLESAADRPAAAYSGGMRRRLSVAAALLGSPGVVYLDEPTTGMDPVTRRHVWELLLGCREGRVMVLTTHSLEEAQLLGDRVAILVAGRLRCLGPSLALRRRYGGGYVVSLGLAALLAAEAGQRGGSGGDCGGGGGGGSPRDRLLLAAGEAEEFDSGGGDGGGGSSGAGSDGGSGSGSGSGGSSGGGGEAGPAAAAVAAAAAVRRLAAEALGAGGDGQAVEVETGRSHLHLRIPRHCEARLPELFDALEARGSELGVVDIQVRLSTLEDVYMNVIRSCSANSD
ncbi:hypothetical protein HYH03_009829 [Edaphochlamys debaryana]|uniref:ABC transporter domain-containing protein n=1 Tax=Edaphochlamys debaryana TaxID=47281 RepID=A0A836BXC3_9CHLO|nr:hypothetical protein HYH03_009829 [Edaphochlamys debaryana]|eukprot:KAG2491877.1 hypothetical protein HYH03_009829 [Edaphochlamys debaryana]